MTTLAIYQLTLSTTSTALGTLLAAISQKITAPISQIQLIAQGAVYMDIGQGAVASTSTAVVPTAVPGITLYMNAQQANKLQLYGSSTTVTVIVSR